MNTGVSPAAGPIYPAYCFPKAPTYQKWVKLTAADVQRLRREPGFELQNIYFHLNHPIEFVYLIGPVVAINHLTTRYNTHFSTLELDDGSGEVIEVKITYKPAERAPIDQTPSGNSHPTTSKAGTDNGQDSSEDEEDDKGSAPTKPQTLRPQIFETTVADLLVIATPSGYHTTLANEPIGIGTVLKIKGTLQTFRGAFQVNLRRAFIVRSLDEEVAAWADYALFAEKVLSKPWVLGHGELKALEKERRQEAMSARHKAAKRRAYEAKRRIWEDRVAEKEAKRERRRVEEARLLDGNALDRPRALQGSRVPGVGMRANEMMPPPLPPVSR